MSDLVSRKAVMELIESKCVNGCLGTDDTTLIDAHGLIDDVSDLPSVNSGWISCSERLPEKYGEYIAMIAGAEESTHLWYAPDCCYWEDEVGNTYSVLAWQPYPASYDPDKGRQTNAERIRTMKDSELAAFLKPLVSQFTTKQEILNWLKDVPVD